MQAYTLETGRGTVEISVDCNGKGEAYFRGDDMLAEVKGWEFAHPYHGAEYRLLVDYKNNTPILQTKIWKNC